MAKIDHLLNSIDIRDIIPLMDQYNLQSLPSIFFFFPFKPLQAFLNPRVRVALRKIYDTLTNLSLKSIIKILLQKVKIKIRDEKGGRGPLVF